MTIIPQTQSFKIFGAGASIGATTLTLQSFKNIDGTNLTMAHFGGTKGFLTIEPSSGTQEEQVSFASITNNANGTVTLGTIKNVLDYTPFTETAGLAKTHGGNVEVIVSNTSGFYNNIIAGTTASEIINVPSGTIAATDVQTAINELATDALALDGLALHKAGAESVTGVKTFDSSTGRPKLSTDVDTAVDAEFPTWGQVARTAVAGAPNASTTVKGIVEEATDAEVLASTTTGGTGARLFINPGSVGNAANKIPFVGSDGKLPFSILQGKFGGTGSDGALSGTTVIDLGSAQVVVKNYTSISLTGTQTLTFTNPHANGTTIILKSQGNVTLTSSAAALIDASGMGAIGGTATQGGLTVTAGRGGAGLYIECAGALNFTGTIKNNGTNATSSGSSTQSTSITRGGPKGSTLILYNTLTANSGTSQTSDGTDLAAQAGSVVSTTASNGNDANGIYNLAYGGQGGGLAKTPSGTLFFPWVVSSYSKVAQIIPSSGSGTGMLGNNTTNGMMGIGGGVNLIALNTEFS